MTQDYSDAPLTIDGITVQPNWKWSAQYRASVAEGMRASGRSDLSPSERKDRYVEWYASQHGLTLREARERVEAMS